MRKFTAAATLCVIAGLTVSASARAALVSGPTYVSDTSTNFAAAFEFDAINTSSSFTVSPSTSPSGLWGVGSIGVSELAHAPATPDAVNITGSIMDNTRGTSSPFTLSFNALSGTVPPVIIVNGSDTFAAQVQFQESDNHISGYGLGVGARVPEPATLTLLGVGLFGAGVARLRRII
jgi:hypothetical protein